MLLISLTGCTEGGRAKERGGAQQSVLLTESEEYKEKVRAQTDRHIDHVHLAARREDACGGEG